MWFYVGYILLLFLLIYSGKINGTSRRRWCIKDCCNRIWWNSRTAWGIRTTSNGICLIWWTINKKETYLLFVVQYENWYIKCKCLPFKSDSVYKNNSISSSNRNGLNIHVQQEKFKDVSWIVASDTRGHKDKQCLTKLSEEN